MNEEMVCKECGAILQFRYGEPPFCQFCKHLAEKDKVIETAKRIETLQSENEQLRRERDVLAMKLVMELPICPASFGFCPHDFRHCELPDQSPESEQQCWLSWASQEAAKQGDV